MTCPLISCTLDAPACSLNGYKQKYAELLKDFIESRTVFQISMATNADMGLITSGQGGKLAAWRVYTAWSKHANHVQGTLSTQEKPTRVQSCTKSDPTKELQRPRRRSTSRAGLQQACPARLQRPWTTSVLTTCNTCVKPEKGTNLVYHGSKVSEWSSDATQDGQQLLIGSLG